MRNFRFSSAAPAAAVVLKLKPLWPFCPNGNFPTHVLYYCQQFLNGKFYSTVSRLYIQTSVHKLEDIFTNIQHIK